MKALWNTTGTQPELYQIIDDILRVYGFDAVDPIVLGSHIKKEKGVSEKPQIHADHKDNIPMEFVKEVTVKVWYFGLFFLCGFWKRRQVLGLVFWSRGDGHPQRQIQCVLGA